MKREREKHITRLHIILFFLTIIIGLTVFFIIKGALLSEDKYLAFEKSLEDASKIYYRINKLDLEENTEVFVDIEKLDEQGLVVENNLIEKCVGYVKISNEMNYSKGKYGIRHRANIKCGDKYITSTYSDGTYLRLKDE